VPGSTACRSTAGRRNATTSPPATRSWSPARAPSGWAPRARPACPTTNCATWYAPPWSP